MDAASILRRARTRAGLSQRELAARTGMAQPSIARIETGGVSPRFATLSHLLRGCDHRLQSVPFGDVDLSQIVQRRSWSLRERLEELRSAAESLGALVGKARQ